jgi:hypothetical protein
MARAKSSRITAAAASLAIGVAAPALAQGVLTHSDQSARADVYFHDGSSQIGVFGLTPDFSGADFYAVEDRSFAAGGFSGRAYAEHGATFTPSSPLIGGSFTSVILDSCTSAEVFSSNIGPHVEEVAHGVALGIIEFTLAAPMNWTWAGGWQGYSFNTGSYNRVSGLMSLIDLNLGTQHVNQTQTSLNGAGDWNQTFFLGGTLGPGQYQLSWGHESLVTGGNTPFGFFPTAFGGAPLISCINSTFSLVPAPSAVALLSLAGLSAAHRRRRA